MQENNTWGKTIDLFKKTGDIKATLHAKMGTIKDRNGKDQLGAEEIKKKWQEERTKWQRSRWTWSASLSMDALGIQLETEVHAEHQLRAERSN